MKRILFMFVLFIFCTIEWSCTKDPGLGGNSAIFGKIIAHNYNAEFTELKGIYPAYDEDVFIIYGDDKSFSERIRSSYEGIYEFKYLRPGDYTIYVYSKDSTLMMPAEMYPVISKVTIDDNNQTVEVPDMKIFR